MLSELREKVIEFMENDEQFSKLKGDKWYKMEDKLVRLCEKVSGRRDTTYDCKEIARMQEITEEWLGGVASDGEINDFIDEVLELEYKTFSSVIDLVNRYFRPYNTDGEIDGLAMDIEELFEGVKE